MGKGTADVLAICCARSAEADHLGRTQVRRRIERFGWFARTCRHPDGAPPHVEVPLRAVRADGGPTKVQEAEIVRLTSLSCTPRTPEACALIGIANWCVAGQHKGCRMKTHVSNLKSLISYLQDMADRGMVEPEQAKALIEAFRRCDHALTVGDRRGAQKRLSDLTLTVWKLLSGRCGK
jgi:hypothetical protein